MGDVLCTTGAIVLLGLTKCSWFCSFFFFSSRRRHTRCLSDWSSDVCSSDLTDFDAHLARFQLSRRDALDADVFFPIQDRGSHGFVLWQQYGKSKREFFGVLCPPMHTTF